MENHNELRQNAIEFIKSNDSTHKVEDLENYSLIVLIKIKTEIEMRKYRNNGEFTPGESSI